MRFAVCAVLALGLAGCENSSDPGPTPPPEFAVSPAAQWAGGTILVRSQFFAGLDSLPAITAAGIEMVTARMDDSTVSATLPSLPSQTVAIEVVDATTDYLVDSVGVVGFRKQMIVTPMAIGNPVMAPHPKRSGPHCRHLSGTAPRRHRYRELARGAGRLGIGSDGPLEAGALWGVGAT